MAHTPTPRHRATAWAWALAAGSILTLGQAGQAGAATPAEQLAGYSTQAAQPAVAARGQQFFTRRHGRDWACADCHGNPPTGAGQHASTGKAITPLAPGFNAERFTDAAKTEKWFRRNCQDVAGRDCTAAEKADVLAWLMSLK